MAPPHFAMFWADQVPIVSPAEGVSVTVVAGALGDTKPPSPPPHSYASRVDSDVAIWLVRLAAGTSWELPPATAGSNRFLYFFDGRGLAVAGQSFADRALLAVDPESSIPFAAEEGPVEILVLQGRPIAEPVAQYGPFVMNTRAELQQAFADYQRTQFGGWPWPSTDPVNGREGRFARRPDGVVERPELGLRPAFGSCGRRSHPVLPNDTDGQHCRTSWVGSGRFRLPKAIQELALTRGAAREQNCTRYQALRNYSSVLPPNTS